MPRYTDMRRILVSLGLAAVIAAGCGGGEGPRTDPAPRPDSAEATERVVRAWSAAMARSDIDAASDLFAVPATISNGTPEEELPSRAAVRLFNESLPCGSKVVRTEPHFELVIATFRLTKRPGARCDGTGNLAKAAFEVRGGKIVRWIRVPGGGGPAAPEGEFI